MIAEGVRNDLCSGCGRWHDHTGASLLGMYDWRGKFWPVIRGTKPYENADDLGGRVYGFCVMAAAPLNQKEKP